MHAAERNRQAEQRLLLTRIAAEVGQTLVTLQLRHSQVEAFTRDALPPAQRNVELLRRGWQAGKFDLFRVITALRELAEVRTRYLLMLEQLWLAPSASNGPSVSPSLRPLLRWSLPLPLLLQQVRHDGSIQASGAKPC